MPGGAANDAVAWLNTAATANFDNKILGERKRRIGFS
jgi:hypothetical protein